MARIALLGGAFDPPHSGHLLIISAIINSSLIDQVWLVPTGNKRDKSLCASAKQRQSMLEIFLKENFQNTSTVRLEPCQIDDRLPGSHTIDLLDFLKPIYPEHNFFFIIGSDLVDNLNEWKQPQRLQKEVQFIVLMRPGFDISKEGAWNFHCIPQISWASSSVSSTAARNLIAEKKQTAGLITPAVKEFILKEGLYV